MPLHINEWLAWKNIFLHKFQDSDRKHCLLVLAFKELPLIEKHVIMSLLLTMLQGDKRYLNLLQILKTKEFS